MASREGISPYQSLAQSPLPLWSAALLGGQALAALRCSLDGSLQSAIAAAAALALLSRRCRAATAIVLALVGYHQANALMQPPRDPGHVASFAPGRVALRARIVEIAQREAGKLRLVLEVRHVERDGRWSEARGRVQMTLVRPRRAWRVGAVVEALVTLRRPRNFGNPGEFDYEAYLARRRIYATAFLRDDAELHVVEEAVPSWIDSWRERVRVLLGDLDSPAREIVAALILGEMGALPLELQRQFAAAGVSHVLSISGLHVAMVGGAAYAIFRWLLARSEWLLLRTRVPLIAAGLSLLPVWLYAELAQAGVATWRSLVMLGALVGAVLVGRKSDLFANVAAAAVVVGILWPGVALDVSFQLSFVAVIALAMGTERFWAWWRVQQEARLLHLRGPFYRWLGWALASVAVNVSALAGTTPLTAFHFNQVAPIALLANPVIVPLLGTVAVALGLIGALLALGAEAAARACLHLAGSVCALGAWLCAGMAELPGAGVRVVTPSPWELLLLYAALINLALPRGLRRRLVFAVLGLLAIADVGGAIRQRYFRAELQLAFLSVGQGDSAVIEFPGAEVMVVDGGGLYGFDSGERVVAPYLWRQRIGRVDYLVLTHPQYDHYGGLASVARNFAPREFWHSGASSASASFAALREEVRRSGAREVIARAGMSRQIGGCRVDVLWPPADLRRLDVNDASVVLRLACAAASALFAGDLEAAGERALLATGEELRSDVLKVGHHGSRTSSTAGFLAAVRPRIAVVSAGWRNRFGFPDGGVLRRLDEAGARVRRTDVEGAVVLRSPFR